MINIEELLNVVETDIPAAAPSMNAVFGATIVLSFFVEFRRVLFYVGN